VLDKKSAGEERIEKGASVQPRKIAKMKQLKVLRLSTIPKYRGKSDGEEEDGDGSSSGQERAKSPFKRAKGFLETGRCTFCGSLDMNMEYCQTCDRHGCPSCLRKETLECTDEDACPLRLAEEENQREELSQVTCDLCQNQSFFLKQCGNCNRRCCLKCVSEKTKGCCELGVKSPHGKLKPNNLLSNVLGGKKDGKETASRDPLTSSRKRMKIPGIYTPRSKKQGLGKEATIRAAKLSKDNRSQSCEYGLSVDIVKQKGTEDDLNLDPPEENKMEAPRTSRLETFVPPQLKAHAVQLLVERLSKEALELQGLFRIEGNIMNRRSICSRLLQADLDLSIASNHELASILKMYLRDQPEALVPTENYDDFVSFMEYGLKDFVSPSNDIVDSPSTSGGGVTLTDTPLRLSMGAESSPQLQSARPRSTSGLPSAGNSALAMVNVSRKPKTRKGTIDKYLRDLILGLPEERRETFYILFPFLREVSHHSEKNMMSANNIARMFAPAIVRQDLASTGELGTFNAPDDRSWMSEELTRFAVVPSLEVMQFRLNRETRVVEYLISRAHRIFRDRATDQNV